MQLLEHEETDIYIQLTGAAKWCPQLFPAIQDGTALPLVQWTLPSRTPCLHDLGQPGLDPVGQRGHLIRSFAAERR